MDLDISKILRILPHRYPFLLIDRVTQIAPRQSIEAIKCVTINEPYFQGHFPGQPMMPGGLILEAFAQLTALLVHASEPVDHTKQVMYFLGVEEARFRRPVVPGDRLTLSLDVLQHRSNIWKVDCRAVADGNLCTTGKLLMSLSKHSDLPQGHAEQDD